MTISTWLLILTFAFGSGTGLTLSDSPTDAPSAIENGEPVDSCWVNGVWYNPCPGDSPWEPGLPRDTLPPP